MDRFQRVHHRDSLLGDQQPRGQAALGLPDVRQGPVADHPGAGAVVAETEMIMLTFQLGEMVELFGTLYLNEGLEMDAAVERANAIFSALDINNDGDVTEEEFVRGCMEVRCSAVK